MVFVRFDCNTISVAASPATLVASIKDDISLRVGICANELLLSFGGKPLRDSLCLADYYIEAESTLHISRRLLGGKGGFGSLLRATSVKIGTKKTDDFGACRDLNGRRLRHVEAEKKLVDWYSKPHDTPEHEIAMAYSAIKKGTKMRKECRFGVNCKYKWKCKETHPDDNAHITRKQELTNLSRAFGEKNKPIPEALSTPEDMLDAVQMGLREDRLRRAEAKRIAEEKKRAEQDAISPPSTKRARITQPVWTCDSCSMAFYDSSAVRFRCVECDDYDCCASCYETVGKTHDHPMLQVSGEGAVDLEALQADDDDEDDVDTSLYSALASTPAPVHVPAAATTSPSAAIEPTAVSPPSVAEPSSSSSQPTQAAEEQAADKATQDAQDKPAALEKEYAAVNLADFESAEALLAAHTPDHLKAELTKRGLKCGGAPLERAKRLFLLKTHTLATIDKKHLAAPASQR